MDTTMPLPPIWPLPGTRMSHARLTWAEWTGRQAANLVDLHECGLIPTRGDQQTSVALFERAIATRLAWPLPATQLPNAHLTWTTWLKCQPYGPAAGQLEPETCERAA